MAQTSKYLRNQFINFYVALGKPMATTDATYEALSEVHFASHALVEAEYKDLPLYFTESTHHDEKGMLLATFDTCQKEFEITEINGSYAFCQSIHNENEIPLEVVKQFKALMVSAYTRALAAQGMDGVPVNVVKVELEEKFVVTEVSELEGL